MLSARNEHLGRAVQALEQIILVDPHHWWPPTVQRVRGVNYRRFGSPDGHASRCSYRCSLPHAGQEAMTHASPILRVSWQIPGQKSLLVEQPPEQERQHPGEREEAPVRAECDR